MQRFRRPIWKILIVALLFGGQVLAQLPSGARDDETQQTRVEDEAPGQLRDFMNQLEGDIEKSPLSTQEQDTATAISDKVKATEWLGALAPVAISPFFGLTCLSGIAILGEDRLPEDHYLRRASTPLRHPLVFLTFLILTIITSVPKFSKVSKPFAQAVDQLETYSAIIILLVVRFMGGIEMGPPDSQTVVLQAGIVEFSAETLLMLATVVNIVVINTVKFFFEVMIWITPVPFIDAMFEAASKALCAALAVVYAFNPAIATLINLAILACCLFVFAWVKRREVYYRTILFDFVRHWYQPESDLPSDGKLIVFPKKPIGGIPAMAKCELSKSNEGWLLRMPRWFRPAIEHRWTDDTPTIESGLLRNKLQVQGTVFQFGKRFNKQLPKLASLLGAKVDGSASEQRPVGSLVGELA